MRRWVVDAALAGLLLGSFLLIPLRWAHLVTGYAAVALVVAHLLTRPGLTEAAAGLRLRRWRGAGVLLIVAVLLAMLISGVIQQLGSAAAVAWHAGTGTALLVVAAVHVWNRRRRLVPRTARAQA